MAQTTIPIPSKNFTWKAFFSVHSSKELDKLQLKLILKTLSIASTGHENFNYTYFKKQMAPVDFEKGSEVYTLLLKEAANKSKPPTERDSVHSKTLQSNHRQDASINYGKQSPGPPANNASASGVRQTAESKRSHSNQVTNNT